MNVNYLSVTASQGPAAGSTLLDNLIAYWNFDESSGSYTDEINSNVLVNSGVVQGNAGKISNGATFDTSSDDLSIAYNSSLEFGTTDSFTISFWLYLNNTPATAGRIFYACRFSMTSGYSRAIQVRFPTDGVYVVVDFYTSTGTNHTCESYYGKFTTGAWNHFVVYKNSSTTKTYINGVDWTSSAYSTPGNVLAFNQSLFIGNYDGSSTTAIDGAIDEFAYWNRQLTTDEIAELYNSGSGKTHPFNA